MDKMDQLIEKFKELKEELNKNVNMSYAGGTNTAGMPARMGTSGAQGGMYRSEEMDKQAVAPPATMNLSEDGMKKQMVSASPGGAQDIMQMSVKFEKNGQWRLDKVDLDENVNIPHPKTKAKIMPMIGKAEDPKPKYSKVRRLVGAKTGHGYEVETKHSSGNTTRENPKIAGTNMRRKSGWQHEGLTHTNTWMPIEEHEYHSWKSEETKKGEGKETKHDRCAREVAAQGNVDNPHAVCVAAGVKPEKWKKSLEDKCEALIKTLQDLEKAKIYDIKTKKKIGETPSPDIGQGAKARVAGSHNGITRIKPSPRVYQPSTKETKVHEPQVGSYNLMEQHHHEEGSAKKKKYQGGDPRHQTTREGVTRHGKERELTGEGEKHSYTSGVSERGYPLREEKGSHPKRTYKKSIEMADDIIEKLEKHYTSLDGKNREANPKLRQSDLGPGGKVHMIKEEGTNEEANSSQPHNKGKFKVMETTKEKRQEPASPSGLPYRGKDKAMHKDEGGAQCDSCGKQMPASEIHETPVGDIHCQSCADKAGIKKTQMGHIQGNEVKGNDENKAPGRGTLSV